MLLSCIQCMHDHHDDVAEQTRKDTDGQPFEEKPLGSRKLRCMCSFGRVLVLVLLGQGFAARAIVGER